LLAAHTQTAAAAAQITASASAAVLLPSAAPATAAMLHATQLVQQSSSSPWAALLHGQHRPLLVAQEQFLQAARLLLLPEAVGRPFLHSQQKSQCHLQQQKWLQQSWQKQQRLQQ
jgi:hypothetical protein